MGALLTFAPNSNGATSILARVGVSLISTEQACANAEQEIPDFDFAKTRAASRAQWSELLGRIQVNPQGVDSEFVDLFYSSLYRTHLSPADCKYAIVQMTIRPHLTMNEQTRAKTPCGILLNRITIPSTVT